MITNSNKEVTILLSLLLISSCITPIEITPDLESNSQWVGEWYKSGEDSGFVFKGDGSADYFYYKGNKRFSVKDAGYFKLFNTNMGNRCIVKLNALYSPTENYRLARWAVRENVLYLSWDEINLSFIKPDTEQESE